MFLGPLLLDLPCIRSCMTVAGVEYSQIMFKASVLILEEICWPRYISRLLHEQSGFRPGGRSKGLQGRCQGDWRTCAHCWWSGTLHRRCVNAWTAGRRRGWRLASYGRCWGEGTSKWLWTGQLWSKSFSHAWKFITLIRLSRLTQGLLTPNFA